MKTIKDTDGIEYAILDVTTKHQTDDAVLFDYDGKDTWIPKSVMEDWPDIGDNGEAMVKMWFAVEKGLV